MVNWATIEAAKMKMKKVSQKLLETALLNVAMGLYHTPNFSCSQLSDCF
jgi:hypothetical protein